jgi:arylsulfatase
MRTGIQFVQTAVFLALVCGSSAHAEEKPNIVLVFMDNFGWGEPGFNGGGIIRGTETPRLDKLASEGLNLKNFNVEVQCTPSRSAIMTGRYAIRSGNSVAPLGGGIYGLVQWEITMAEMLSEAGYATGIYGKWHLGRTEGRFPTDQGFDEWYGIPNSSDESLYPSRQGFAESGVEKSYVMESRKGETPRKVREWNVDYRPLIDVDLTDKAIDFMKRKTKENKPFFIFLPYTATHVPVMPHPAYKGKTGNGDWADLLYQIDQLNGRLLDAIDELGIRDNTIFIFTADNGPEGVPAGNHSKSEGFSYVGTAGPWNGTLFTGYEGALRVPFVIRWPGKIKPDSVSNEMVHEMDLFPTLAKLAGGKVPTDRVIDGVDQSDFLLGKQAESNREGFIVYMGTDIFGVKWRDWKLTFAEMDSALSDKRSYNFLKTYNLLTDPGETESRTVPDSWVAKAGLVQFAEHLKSLKENPPIPTGAPDPYEAP